MLFLKLFRSGGLDCVLVLGWASDARRLVVLVRGLGIAAVLSKQVEEEQRRNSNLYK